MAYFSAATAILTATNCRKDMNFGVAVDRSCQTSWGKRLSNTNHQHWQLMHSMAAFNAIQHRHASHLFQLEKPNQAIFRAFESATQARSCDILYFDDLADNIAAATQAGWRAILIDPHGETVPQIRRALATHGVLL